jgi:hypothetical protein
MANPVKPIPPDFKLNPEQTALMISQIANLTDVDPFIIECGAYTAPELARIFNNSVTYHNRLVNMQDSLKNVKTENTQKFPGEYARDVTLKSHAAEAMKITAQLDHVENRMQAVRDSLRLRAQLKLRNI